MLISIFGVWPKGVAVSQSPHDFEDVQRAEKYIQACADLQETSPFALIYAQNKETKEVVAWTGDGSVSPDGVNLSTGKQY